MLCNFVDATRGMDYENAFVLLRNT